CRAPSPAESQPAAAARGLGYNRCPATGAGAAGCAAVPLEKLTMAYSPLMIRPMREELLAVGFEELTTVADVEKFLDDQQGTALLVINSVCGCAAGMARPGVRLALQEAPRPDRLVTVFAGHDVEATAR